LAIRLQGTPGDLTDRDLNGIRRHGWTEEAEYRRRADACQCFGQQEVQLIEARGLHLRARVQDGSYEPSTRVSKSRTIFSIDADCAASSSLAAALSSAAPEFPSVTWFI
jgi:hypothetical protein